MNILIGFLPIVLFVTLFVGSGLYFTFEHIPNAFYQLPPTVAILPALALGWVLYRGNNRQRTVAFLEGVRHRDIITMCIVFLLAGAFSSITQSIGSVDATVNLALSLIPTHLLLIGLFLTTAFISTAIGSSMGTIATIAPIAASLISQGVFPAALGMATVVGGAMFGDDLSVISDTTIAATMSQEASVRKKLKFNAILALFASLITIFALSAAHETTASIPAGEYSLILVVPYLLLIGLAGVGVNVFVALCVAIACAGTLGILFTDYTVLKLSADLYKGFASVQEIMLLSLLVGGLSGLAGQNSKHLAIKLGQWIAHSNSQKAALFVIGQIVSIFDILLANNTVAIIFSGEITRDLAQKYRIEPHVSATILQLFACVFQGIIPYGVQILLASNIAGISPLSIVPYVYYCYALAVVGIAYILLRRKPRQAL